MIKFDIYSLKARVYPCSIVLLPCLLLAIFYITNIEAYYHYLTSFIGIGVFSFVLAQIGRDQGKKKEKKLFEHWGGKPTNMILRHSNNHLDVHTKKRFHTKLEQVIPDMKIPTPEEELEDLYAADCIYDSCTKYLISKTRDTNKYHLLFKENINYGFRRNLWGMKAWALTIIVGCLIIHAVIATEKFTTFETPNTTDWLLLATLVIISMFWLFTVNKEWIKVTAFAYAERLHETLHE
jgi:hypothetical protein